MNMNAKDVDINLILFKKFLTRNLLYDQSVLNISYETDFKSKEKKSPEKKTKKT